MAKSGGKRKRKKKISGLYLSIMVIHRIEDTMELVSSIKSFREMLSARLAARYSPRLLPGETLPDAGLLLDLAVRDVRANLDLLAELDDQVAFARTDQVTRRKELTRLVRDELYPRTVAVRGEIDLAFGRANGRRLHGMKGKTRRQPPALQAQLRRALHRFADPERQMPPPKNRYAAVDRERWLRELQPLYLRLEALNKEVDRGEHVVPALTSEKNAAMEAFDLSYRDALRLTKAAFAAAGLNGKPIQSLKPYYRRRRMSAQARKKRQARATASEPTVEQAAPRTQASDRVAVPMPIARWLADNRRLVSA